jgi:hypothetical protein
MKFIPLVFMAAASLVQFRGAATAQDLARPTIIDSSKNTKQHAKLLADLGVTVIGRYYGRCPQWDEDRKERIVRAKRMIDNVGEVDAILDDKRLNILSVYQFYSQSSKFDKERAKGRPTVLDDRPEKDNPKTIADFNKCITPTRPNTIQEDANFDAQAAVIQAAEIIGQPKKTAIYFGVDFDLTMDRRENVLIYFDIVKEILDKNDYQLGVYGNGSVADLLYEKKLVKYVWLNASQGHQGSAKTFNDNHWDILQTKIEVVWTLGKDDSGQVIKFSLDTNMQNPESSYVGFWNRGGPSSIQRDRNLAVHSARRFVCEGFPSVFDDKGQKIRRPQCTTSHGIALRTYELNAGQNLVRVDCDEDGTSDGWMKVADISHKRPEYVEKRLYPERARNTHCSAR